MTTSNSDHKRVNKQDLHYTQTHTHTYTHTHAHVHAHTHTHKPNQTKTVTRYILSLNGTPFLSMYKRTHTG